MHAWKFEAAWPVALEQQMLGAVPPGCILLSVILAVEIALLRALCNAHSGRSTALRGIGFKGPCPVLPWKIYRRYWYWLSKEFLENCDNEGGISYLVGLLTKPWREQARADGSSISIEASATAIASGQQGNSGDAVWLKMFGSLS